jgi:hypothetical protein
MLGAWISPGGFVAYPEGEAGVARELLLPPEEQLPGDPFFGGVNGIPTPPERNRTGLYVAGVALVLLLGMWGRGSARPRRRG